MCALKMMIIVLWIRLHLPSCWPGFESQAYHLHFYHLYSNLRYICHLKRTKINKKRGRVQPIKSIFGNYLHHLCVLVSKRSIYKVFNWDLVAPSLAQLDLIRVNLQSDGLHFERKYNLTFLDHIRKRSLSRSHQQTCLYLGITLTSVACMENSLSSNFKTVQADAK